MQQGVFVDSACNEFIFSGWNQWQAIEAALGLCCGGPKALAASFEEAGELHPVQTA